jgi:DNA-binding transcriptional LysR family regulator
MVDRRDEMALLVAAVDQGSLSGAARIKRMSLASVSRHLGALEERLGVRLLVRSTRALTPTDAGRSYYAAAKKLLAEIDDMEAGLTAEGAAPVGRLQITGPTLFGRVHMLPLLAKFMVQYPKLTLDVSLIDRPVNLIDEGIDIAVVVGEQPDSNIVARRLGAVRWVLAASPDYLSERGQPSRVEELSAHDGLIISHYTDAASWTFNKEGHSITVRPNVRMRTNTFDGVVAAAAAGAGIALAPAWAVSDHVASGRLRILLPESEMPPRPIYALMTHQRLLAGKIRVLLDYLVAQLATKNLHL